MAHPDTLCGAAVVITLAGWYAATSDGSLWRGFLFAVLLVAVLWVAGTVVGRLVDPSRVLPWAFPLTFVAGALAVSMIALVLRFLLPVAPWIVLLAIGAAGLASLSRLRRPGLGAGPAALPAAASMSSLIAVVVSLLATTLWVRVNLSPFAPGDGGLVYRAWPESFILSQAILLMQGAALPQTLGDPEFAGASLPVYHYGGFLLGAAFASFTRTSALATVDGFVIPFALLLVPLSIYALGSYWWGPRAGLASLAFGILLPDASLYGFSNPLFGYYFLLRTSPTMAWGVAGGTLAILLLAAGSRERHRPILLSGAVTGLLVFNFKAQVFALAAPVVILWVCLSRVAGRRTVRLTVLALVAAAGAAGALYMGKMQLGPDLAFDDQLGRAYLQRIPLFQPDPESREPVRALFAGLPRPAVPAVGAPFLLAASFGILPLVYGLLLLRRWIGKQARADDLLPLLVMGGYLGFALLMGTGPTGPYYELQHRPFVWVYALLAAWTGGGLLRWIDERWAIRRWGPWGAGLGVLLLGPALLAGATDGRRLPLPRTWFDVPFSEGYLRCARYARVHGAPADIVQDSKLDPRLYTLGLSERRAYLARPSRRGADRDRGVRETIRIGELDRLRSASTRRELAASAARIPVRWYLVHPATRLAWPETAGIEPACAGDGYRLFDLAAIRGGSPPAGSGGPDLSPYLANGEPVTVYVLDPGLGVDYLRDLYERSEGSLEEVRLHEAAGRPGDVAPIEQAVLERLREGNGRGRGRIVLARREPPAPIGRELESIIKGFGAEVTTIGTYPADGGAATHLAIVENAEAFAKQTLRPLASWYESARETPEMTVGGAGLYGTDVAAVAARGYARIWVKMAAPRPSYRLLVNGVPLAASVSGGLITAPVPYRLLAGRRAIVLAVWDIQAGRRSPPVTIELP